MLGSLISAISPWTWASIVYIWIALVAAGASMFVLARRWLDRPSAMFAAVLYAVNPYHLVIVYWRSSFAELLAASLVPLLLLLVLSAEEKRWRVVVPVGIVLAAAWLTNAPAAVMIHYSLALLVLFLACTGRNSRLLLIAAAAVVLGACLSAFYLLPAIYEQRWVEIGNAVSPGSRPADNFLFVHTTDPDHDAFNRLISWVGVLEIVIVLVAAVKARLWRKTKFESWNVLLLWAAACSVLIFPISSLLWRILPKLQFMQFPWRWLLCLSLISTTLVVVGFERWWGRAAVCGLSLLVILVVWHRVQAPWWDNAADLREMQDNVATGAGYDGTDEYTPVGADPSAIDKDARKVTIAGPAKGAIHVLDWNAESKHFTAEVSKPDQLALRLFPYPAWKVAVNGRVVQTSAREGSGQMLIPVEAGMNRIQITLVRTWDRMLGGWISVAGVVGISFWFLWRRRLT